MSCEQEGSYLSNPHFIELKELFYRANGAKPALFIGSGFSNLAGFPTWPELLGDLITKSKHIIVSENNAINSVEKVENKLFKASLIRHLVGDNAFYKMLEDVFDSEMVLPSEITNALRHFLDVNDINLIITTNYDRSLEKSLGHEWVVYKHNQCEKVNYELKKGSKILFKIHGCIKEDQSTILTLSDYQKLYYKRQDFRFLLSSLLDKYTFIFFGFSLTDPFFSMSFDLLYAYYGRYVNEHFAIMPSINEAEKLAWKNFRGIKVISLEIEREDKDSDQKRLEKFTKKYSELLGALEKDEPRFIPYHDRVEIIDPLNSIADWSNSGADPVIVHDDDRTKVIKAFRTYRNGILTNCSLHKNLHENLSIIEKGSKVTATVEYKCNEITYGRIFIGDAGGKDPYDNKSEDSQPGNNRREWKMLSTSVNYKHDDICKIFLYGSRDQGKEGDYVLYKNLRVVVEKPKS